MPAHDITPGLSNSGLSNPEDESAYEPDFSSPPGLSRSLWRSLLGNLRDTVSPETLPPLVLTSRPVEVGMLAGDIVSMPWYRTIFTNLGDVISPETLPPLELESRPVEVGELIGDQLNHMWWSSLLRSLADVAAPERQPALQLTSKPGDPGFSPGPLLLVHWSMVISGPKAHLPLEPKTGFAPANLRPWPSEQGPRMDAGEMEFIQTMEIDLKRDLWRSRFRNRLWASIVVAQVALLVAGLFWTK